ncbi:MAG TPA: agmatinase [Alphaproteobacteria bacterium]|nr:agmatinase [Alphaproteobacteria bacterium]
MPPATATPAAGPIPKPEALEDLSLPFAGIRTFLGAPNRREPGDLRHPVAILGLPFDGGTVFRPGSRSGPAAIREMSLALTGDDHPELALSPADRLGLFDVGDVIAEVGDIPGMLTAIEEEAERLIAQDCHIVGLGGDHTVTLPLLRAQARRHGPISLVQFDAHPDTWPGGDAVPVFHGSPIRVAIEEGLIDPESSIQIGLRSPVQREVAAWTRASGLTGISAEEIHMEGIERAADRVRETVGARPAYLTFDMDVLDPSQAPGTGTPEIGGLFSWQALAMVKRLVRLNWTGMDVVEVAPPYDHAGITALAAASIAWNYLCHRAARFEGND